MYPKHEPIDTHQKCDDIPVHFPPQSQPWHPGLEYLMEPRPISENPHRPHSHKLLDRVAIITGGDSGIGRAVAYAFAKEGADLVISYLSEHEDAIETKKRVEEIGRDCLLVPGDLQHEQVSVKVVEKTIERFGKLDVLVNNHAVQFRQTSLLDITEEQLDITFRTNIYAYFFMTKAALPYLKKGSAIINTTSVTSYLGHSQLIDYAATKGAVTTFTRALSGSLADQEIRVNGVAPGPIWTPLIPSSYPAHSIPTFGSDTPLSRPGQPFEVAPSFVFLASDDSKYLTGQILHPNGGRVTGS